MKKTMNDEPKKVEKVELNIKHVKLRFFIVIALILFVIGCGVYALVSVLVKDNGWTEITTDSKNEYYRFGDEFSFQYSLGTSGTSATKENRELTSFYTDKLVKYYQLFDGYKEYEVANVYTLNHSINQSVEVDPALYDALKDLTSMDESILYLGAIYSYYSALCTTDEKLSDDYNPHKSTELQSHFANMISYVNAKDIELLFEENSHVTLKVSKAYQSYMEENEETHYIDFGWLRDAYILEYLSNDLITAKYTYGTLASYSGYFVNLYQDSYYTMNAIDLYNGGISKIGYVETTNAVRGIQFRSFPALNSYDTMYYYSLGGGSYLSTYISTVDGMDKHSLDSLTVYSHEKTLPQVAMHGYKVFVQDSFNKEVLASDSLVDYIYREDKVVHYSEKTYSGLYNPSITGLSMVCDND